MTPPGQTTSIQGAGPGLSEGLFGGTFNPLHNGHIEVIRHVKKVFGLARVHLIPSANPPHKPVLDLAPATDRLHMIEASVAGLPGFSASDVELKRNGPSFTIDTVAFFKDQAPCDTTLFLIMGSDAFFDIGTWKDTHAIFREIALIVMLREGYGASLNTIASFIRDVVSPGYRLDTGRQLFLHQEMKPVHVCKVPLMTVSSTEIRNRIKNNLPIGPFVPAPVETIIKNKGLYL